MEKYLKLINSNMYHSLRTGKTEIMSRQIRTPHEHFGQCTYVL